MSLECVSTVGQPEAAQQNIFDRKLGSLTFSRLITGSRKGLIVSKRLGQGTPRPRKKSEIIVLKVMLNCPNACLWIAVVGFLTLKKGLKASKSVICEVQRRLMKASDPPANERNTL
jgi:hypothetical protein